MNYLTGHRTEDFLVEHLTKEEASKGFLDGVSGGALSWNANATLQGGGHVTLQEYGQDINTSRDRIRVWWQVQGLDPWPLGVYVIAAPDTEYSEDGSYQELSLIDKITAVKDDSLLETLQIPAGSNAVEHAVSVLESTGESRISATASGYTLANDMSWEAGVSKLRVINELMRPAGYRGLWTDQLGQFRMEPYIDPASRTDVYEFIESEEGIHLPTWTYSLPLWEATNQVVLTSQADENDVVFTAYAQDDNPDSPTSIISMGRVLNPIVEENVEASSQVELQAMAVRKLVDNSNVSARLHISHRPIPLWYNDVVRFASQGVDTRAVVLKMDLELAPGALMRTEMRKV